MALSGFTFLAPMLEWVGQKVYPKRMKLLRLFLFVWLSLGLSGSGWAFAPSGCATTGHEHAVATDAASTDPVDHQHHVQHSQAGPEQGAPDAVPACECCDTCMTPCAFSLSAMNAQFSTRVPIFDASAVATGPATQRAPPPTYPLLRPPIPTL